MQSNRTEHCRSEWNRLIDHAMDADERGDHKETARIMREARKAEDAMHKSMEEDKRGWSKPRWPSKNGR